MRNGGFETGTSGIEYFFNPRSIAVVGASPHKRKPGGRPLVALRERGYAGKIFPINPNYEEVAGIHCYPTILDVPDDIDMAIISVPAVAVLEVLEQCASKGVRAAVIFSAGFGEVGAEGEAEQEKIRKISRESGMRVLGPNCFGIMNVSNAVMATFAHELEMKCDSPRTLSLVAQSGAFGAHMFEDATKAGVGCTSFTSVGNEADTEFSDFVDYLLDDPDTKLIGGYLEGAKDGMKLRRAAEKALRLRKPLLITKVGRTRAGSRAASSHTGSLAGDDAIYDAFFRQMGIVRIEHPDEMTAFAILHRDGRDYSGGRVAILSGSGGHGVMLADKCESVGLAVPEIQGQTREKLERSLPAFGSGKNPIDLTAAAGGKPEMPSGCLRALAEDKDYVDVVLTMPFFQWEDRGDELAQEFVDIYRSTNKPIVVVAHHRPDTDEAAKRFALVQSAGMPILYDQFQAAQAITKLCWYQRKAKQGRVAGVGPKEPDPAVRAEVGEMLRGGEPLSEFGCKQILKRYGIPVTREGLATSADMAVELSRSLGYPVALKAQSGQILHKTEAGVIKLNLASDEEVRRAYKEVLANARSYAPQAHLEGVLVQEMVRDGVEVIVGVTKDPVFGPAIMFGLGGIFVEALRDVSFRIAPLTRADAEEMIDEIRGRRVLQGMRGKSPADRAALIDTILRVSQLVTDHSDQIDELDLNPLVVLPKGAKVVDALITKRAR
jgi:acyl-CoA synthetase (NDP forming)